MSSKTLEKLKKEIIACERCPRLRTHCEQVSREKRRAYQDWDYWGKPVPGFGDPQARLMIVGLAPAAHGANRTGRIFTGDRSGDWLYRALYRTGFANQATSTDIQDGLKLHDAWVCCSVRCAPPDNKPLPEEFDHCREYLQREIDTLGPGLRVFVALGGLALGQLELALRELGLWTGKKMKFSHGARYRLESGSVILCSYHPSQQNTFTGRLTDPMFQSIFDEARKAIDGSVR